MRVRSVPPRSRVAIFLGSLLSLLAMAMPGSSLAQASTSPFAGTWQGTYRDSFAPMVCNPPLGGTAPNCDTTRSWSGTVDADGLFTLIFGSGRRVCGTTTTEIAPDGHTYRISNVRAGVNNSPLFAWCDGCFLYLSFSESPSLAVAGSLGSCSCTSTLQDGRACTVTHLQTTLAGYGAPAVAPPPFPMTVTSSIGAMVSSATASIRFRAQDVGKTASVYVFAMAPATVAKDTPGTCVLAQLDVAGQLKPVAGADLHAATTGILSSQGQSVEILRGVATPAIAGATFYVGYGQDASGMFGEGIFRNAVTIPGGTGACAMPTSQTALFWNPAEAGWGLNLNQQGNTLFGTLFTYDASRSPLWLVLSNGAMLADGRTFAGDLYRTTGPPFYADPFTPISAANLTRVGTMSVTFYDFDSGSLRYTVDGKEVIKDIQRQVFGPRAATCLHGSGSRSASTNYQDLWWNPAESGWGINITHQGDTVFATLFTYGSDGKALWLVMSSGARQADGSYLGDLYWTRGAAFDAQPFPPVTPADITKVGSMRLAFSDGEHGTLTYSVSGTQVMKSITRQVFSSPVPACN